MRSSRWSIVSGVGIVVLVFVLTGSTVPVAASQTTSAPATAGLNIGEEDSQGFFEAIVEGAVEGAVAGAVGGAILGAPVGAAEGFIAGIYGGAVAGGFTYWLYGDDLRETSLPKGKLPKTILD